MPETSTISTITPSVSTTATWDLPAATPEVASIGQVFNPVFGQWVSDPLYLPGSPVTGSVTRWSVTGGSAGAVALFETSIDNGLSWQTATNEGAIPRLLPGDKVTSWVLFRVTMSRLSSSDTSPKLSFLEVEVSCDASVDELVAIGHGPIIKVSAKIGSGSGGAGGGPGVSGSGGGMTGRGLSLKIKAVDPSRSIAKAPWERPKVLPSLSYDQAAVALVKDRLPTQEDVSVVSRTRLTDPFIFGLNQGSDSWQDIRDLSTADGCESFFDAAGVFVFRPVADPRVARPVWTFDDGETCTVTQAERELNEEQTFNYVVVKGESTAGQNPASGVAFDDDPASPTYVYGRYGLHSTTVTLSTVTTDEQAAVAARAILFGSLGASETVTITTVPIPMLECGDVVAVSIGDIKADGRYLIVQMTTPLSPGEAQTLTCFRQSSLEGE